MLAADTIITDLSTWDAAAWIAAVASLIALGALVTAVLARLDSRKAANATERSAGSAERSATASERSAMTGDAAVRASRRSADAAERATALQEQTAALEMRDRHEAAGPGFEVVEDAVVGKDLKALVKLRIVGGPGELELEIETRTSWCVGVSSTRDGIAGTVLMPQHEPGDTVAFYAHLSSRPWADDDPVMLPLIVTTEAPDHRLWRRRVSVPVVPEPPVPLVARVR